MNDAQIEQMVRERFPCDEGCHPAYGDGAHAGYCVDDRTRARALANALLTALRAENTHA